LNDELYQLCLKSSREYNRVDGFWDELAKNWGYDNTEKMRSAYRREREKRNDYFPNKTFDSDEYRVIVFDIETLPLKAYAWDVWKQDLNPSQIIDDWVMLSWASKDLMRGEVRSDILTPKEARKRNDRRIVESLWEEFNNASILIGQNIVDFDIPKANTRFLYHGMIPPSPYRTVDTLKILKYNFRFSYNRLDYINTQLGLTPKMSNDGFPLWVKCADGDQKSLDDMSDYNRQDILSGEELYLAVRAWDTRHPNIGLFYDDLEKRCKNCGSTSLEKLGKSYQTALGIYDCLRCNNCGAVGRKAKNKTSKVKRDSLLR
jgi:uncharacterized protein YprB with RNaseH-like and TPR domain